MRSERESEGQRVRKLGKQGRTHYVDLGITRKCMTILLPPGETAAQGHIVSQLGHG